MSIALAGLTADDVQHEALAVARLAFVRVDGLRVVERPGWFQLIMPAWKTGGLNVVALTVVADDAIEAVIDHTLAEYAALGLKFRWVVDPDSRPLDLAARLARRGLTCVHGLAMACPSSSGESVALPPDLTVEQVDHASLDAIEHVMSEGWSMDPAPVRPYHLALLDDPLRNRLYLARCNGVPAAAAAQTCFTHSTYLTGGVVLPAFRGRGLYRALVAARLRDAAASRIAIATTHARVSTSAPILERVGFSTVCDLTSFTND